MKKQMKKIKRLGATLLAATMLMTGCGALDTTTIDESETAKSDSITANGEKVKIEYWHCNAEAQGGAAVEELVNKFNKENDHIEVVAKYNPDMYAGLMKNLMRKIVHF